MFGRQGRQQKGFKRGRVDDGLEEPRSRGEMPAESFRGLFFS
jgi:hypothetical protein